MIRKEEVYKIGMLTKPHGIKGEVAFSFTDDIFDRVDCDYLICLMDGILVPFFIEEYRFKTDTVALVKFEGVDTAEQAHRFTNIEVFFPFHLASENPDEEYSWNYFVGFEVEDTVLGPLGRIVDVDDSTINTLFVIDHDGTELLVPAHEEFVAEVNHEKRCMKLQMPTGLLQLDEAAEV